MGSSERSPERGSRTNLCDRQGAGSRVPLSEAKGRCEAPTVPQEPGTTRTVRDRRPRQARPLPVGRGGRYRRLGRGVGRPGRKPATPTPGCRWLPGRTSCALSPPRSMTRPRGRSRCRASNDFGQTLARTSWASGLGPRDNHTLQDARAIQRSKSRSMGTQRQRRRRTRRGQGQRRTSMSTSRPLTDQLD